MTLRDRVNAAQSVDLARILEVLKAQNTKIQVLEEQVTRQAKMIASLQTRLDSQNQKSSERLNDCEARLRGLEQVLPTLLSSMTTIGKSVNDVSKMLSSVSSDKKTSSQRPSAPSRTTRQKTKALSTEEAKRLVDSYGRIR